MRPDMLQTYLMVIVSITSVYGKGTQLHVPSYIGRLVLAGVWPCK